MTMTTVDKKTVLVCDDNDDILGFIGTLLQHAGFEVKLAHNSREFLAEFKNCRPDVIVLDVRMPEHDGFWIAEQLLDCGNKAPIIFLTAHDCLMYRLYAPVAGASDYLTKPIEPDVLLERINKALTVDAKSSNWLLQSLDYNHGRLPRPSSDDTIER
jgi:DNA-binding response OmpR family regulator